MKPFTPFSSPVGLYWVYGLVSIFLSAGNDVLLDETRAGESKQLRSASRVNNGTDLTSATTRNTTCSNSLPNRQENHSEDGCQPRTLSPALWSKLKLNEYLLQYPGGQETSLEVPIYELVLYYATLLSNAVPSVLKRMINFLNRRNWQSKPDC
jgi:hypothetical protein